MAARTFPRACRAAAALLLLVAAAASFPPGASAQSQQQQQQQQQQAEPVPAPAAVGNDVVITSVGRRDEAALAAVLDRMSQPLPTRRGCATPEPTPAQVGAAAEAVLALRAARGHGSAAAFKASLAGEAPTVVQTYFHVVYPVIKPADVERLFPNGTYGGDDYIARQMVKLNNAYKRAGFQFALAGVDRAYNPAWAKAGYGTSDADTMFRKLRKGAYDALNIFVVLPAGGLLGYATFPLARSSTASMRRLDGVVLHYNTLPSRAGATDQWPYALGETGVHEAGHWFGLYHTFQGACEENGGGDMVADTPPEAAPTFGCAKGSVVDTCPDSKGVDSIHNFMSYSDDECLDTFTPGQIERLVAAFNGLRRGIKVQRAQTG